MIDFWIGVVVGSLTTLWTMFIICAVIVAKRTDREHEGMENDNCAKH